MSAAEEHVPETITPLAEDIILIQNHLNAYCHAVDRGTLDEVAELFHVDAVMTPAYEGGDPLHGRTAIRAWYANYNKYFRSPKVKFLRHQVSTSSIQVNGNEATSSSYFDADVLDTEKAESLRFYGRYDDKLVKEGGSWSFKDRVIQGYYSCSVTDYRMLGG